MFNKQLNFCQYDLSDISIIIIHLKLIYHCYQYIAYTTLIYSILSILYYFRTKKSLYYFLNYHNFLLHLSCLLGTVIDHHYLVIPPIIFSKKNKFYKIENFYLMKKYISIQINKYSTTMFNNHIHFLLQIKFIIFIF